MGVLRFALWGRELIKRAVKLSIRGLDCGPHITRYTMYGRLGEFFDAEPRTGRVLSISESEGIHDLFDRRKSQIVVANYPEYNILKLPFADDSFDFCVSDQVLEHIEGDPQQAVNETYRILKPGGWVIHTTCLMHPVHKAPGDFWRFTPDGLRQLCRRFSHIEQAEGWGNPLFYLVHLLQLRSVPIPHSKAHPLHWVASTNWEDWPVVTWIIARK